MARRQWHQHADELRHYLRLKAVRGGLHTIVESVAAANAVHRVMRNIHSESHAYTGGRKPEKLSGRGLKLV